MSDTPSPPPRFAWDWVGWWTLVFVGNLPIPLLLGVGMVGEAGLFGLCGALAILYLLGATPCGLGWRLGRSLCWGGGAVAASQCLPILQLSTGLVAVKLWNELTGYSTLFGQGAAGAGGKDLVETNLAVCAVVFFTAQPLLLLSLVVGVVIRVLRRDVPIWFGSHIARDELARANQGPQNPFEFHEDWPTGLNDEPKDPSQSP